MEVRGLTPKERKQVFEKTGFTLTNMPEDRFEEVMWCVLEIVCPDVEFEDFKAESEAFNEVITKTYGVSEKDAKN